MARRRFTLDDYFAVEEASPLKHEFFDGEIYAMAGGSVAHNRIVSNLLVQLGNGLRPPCEVFGSDQRLRTPDERLSYPDLSVVCGQPELVPGRPDTLVNPRLLVEVLSDSTREFDQTEKLASYQLVHSLREVLLVEQDLVRIEHLVRTREGWHRTVYTSVDDVVSLGVGVALSVREAYRRVHT